MLCVTLGFWLFQPGCAAATSPHALCQPSPIPGRTKHQLLSLDAPQNKRRGAPSLVHAVPGCANCARSPPKPIWAGEVGPPGSPPGLPWGANPRLEAGAAGWGHGGLGARWVPCSGTRWEVSGDCPHSLLGCDDELVINFSPWMRSVRGVPAHRGTPLVCGDRGGPVLRGQGTVPQAQGKCGRRRAAEDSGAVDALGGSVIGAGCWGAPRGAAPCSLRQPRPAARRGRRYLWLPVNKLPMKES